MTRKAPRFELDPRAAPDRAARAAALAQLDHALAGFARNDPEAIHEARKACKRLRAMLRLFRPLLGRAYRVDNRRLRDVGRALSQGREAAVLVETARAVLVGDDRLEALADRLGERPRPDSSLSRRTAQQLLDAERQRVIEWPLGELSAGSLVAGLLEGYRKARDAYRHARKKQTPLALHEWRKQAKYHGYQIVLANPLWPHPRRRIKQLKKLSDLLGEHHDLHVLAMTLRRDGKTLASRESLREARKLIRAHQDTRATQALALGKMLFGAKPVDWLEESPAP